MKKLFGIAMIMMMFLNAHSQNAPTIISKQISQSKGFHNYEVNFTITPESVPLIDSLRFEWIRFDSEKIQYQFTGHITKTLNSAEYRFDTYFLGPYNLDIYKNSVVYQTDNLDNLKCYVKLSTYFKNSTIKSETFFLNEVNATIEGDEDLFPRMEILKIFDIKGKENYENFNLKITGLYILIYKNGSIKKIFIK